MPLFLQTFIIFIYAIFVKKDMVSFLLSVNKIFQKSLSNYRVISTDAKSLLMNDPDIQLLRKQNKK